MVFFQRESISRKEQLPKQKTFCGWCIAETCRHVFAPGEGRVGRLTINRRLPFCSPDEFFFWRTDALAPRSATLRSCLSHGLLSGVLSAVDHDQNDQNDQREKAGQDGQATQKNEVPTQPRWEATPPKGRESRSQATNPQPG